MSTPAWVRNLGLQVWNKRRESGDSLRVLSETLNISPSTLSRIERGIVEPDTGTLFRVCTWLGVSANSIQNTVETISPEFGQELSTPDVIEVHLRADRHLPVPAARAIAAMVRAAYGELASRPKVGNE